jgi:hypothetical protein
MVRSGAAAFAASAAASFAIFLAMPSVAQAQFVLRPPGLLLPGPIVAYGSPFAIPYRHAPLPPAEIVAILAGEHDFRRIGRPYFAGDVYLVDGVDDAGTVVRAHVHAYSGRLLQVEVLQRQRLARLPATPETQRAIPFPPRRPATIAPGVKASEPASAPVLSPSLSSPIVPLSREPRIVDPAQTRGLDEPDRTPPLASPGRAATSDPG